MHELSIAQNIVQIVKDNLAGLNGNNLQVEKIQLKVGRLRAVIPDNLLFSFEVLSRGSAVEGAYLEIIEIPIRCRCGDCGARFGVDEPYFYCPQCGSGRVDILEGKELFIESIEVERLEAVDDAR